VCVITYEDLDVNLAHRMLYTGLRCSRIHLREGWVGFRATLDILKYRKICYPCRGSNPDAMVIQPTA